MCDKNVVVKELLTLVNIWQRDGQRFGGTFLRLYYVWYKTSYLL